MADDTPGIINLPAVQPAAPVPKQFQNVEEIIPAYDTARFEHMGRIANVMAAGKMIPMSIWNDRKGTDWIELPREIVSARCIMIVDFAQLNRVDPFQAAQAASFVHGRLCWEGKFIDALLQGRHDIVLDASWFDDGGEFDAYDDPARARRAGKGLGIKLVGEVGGKRCVMSGTVAQWETTNNGSPWKNTLEWPKQLKYRGAREWCRVYKPGPITGVLTNDEVEAFAEWRAEHDVRGSQQAPALLERLRTNAAPAADGYQIGHVEREVPSKPSAVAQEGPGDAEDLTVGQGTEMPAGEATAAEEHPSDTPPADDPPPQEEEGGAPAGEDDPPPIDEVPQAKEASSEPAAAASTQRKAGAPKPPPPPSTPDEYMTHAELWIGNCLELDALEQRLKDERKIRNGLREPLDAAQLNKVKEWVDRRKEQLKLQKAGRG